MTEARREQRRRYRQRKTEQARAELDALLRSGSTCAGCAHFAEPDECLFHSRGLVTSKVKPTAVCRHFKAAK